MKWMGAQVLAPIRHLPWQAPLIAYYRKGPTSLCSLAISELEDLFEEKWRRIRH